MMCVLDQVNGSVRQVLIVSSQLLCANRQREITNFKVHGKFSEL